MMVDVHPITDFHIGDTVENGAVPEQEARLALPSGSPVNVTLRRIDGALRDIRLSRVGKGSASVFA